MSTTHERVEFLHRGAPLLFSSLFSYLSEIARVYSLEAATLALLILHHVLVRREQMPLDDRRVFSVVMIPVTGTSRTKRAPRPETRETTAFMHFSNRRIFLSVISRALATASGKLLE